MVWSQSPSVLGNRRDTDLVPIWLARVVIWIFAILLAGFFYAVPDLKRPIYLIWMYTFFPLSWTVSHLLFAAAFYLVMTPIKLGLTLVGYDPLGRRLDRSADTYWHEHNPASDPKRYFRQV